VAVDARAADPMTSAATPGLVDLRSDQRVRAGALAWDSPDVVTGWHRHPYHQVEYALTGVAEVETADGHYLLPPHQAIWIPAGVAHETTLRGVSSVSVFLHPDDVPGDFDRARVVAAVPVLRELMRYAVRWPIDRPDQEDELAELYFRALTRLLIEWLDEELPYSLPTASDPAVRAVIAATNDQLPTATMAGICEAVGVAPRTLRRRFLADTGLTWHEYVVQARLLRAMTLLTSTTRGVLDIATSVGFASPSGFTRAFRKLTGTSPAVYRARRAD
jgi:AraC-like DNA-binding protein